VSIWLFFALLGIGTGALYAAFATSVIVVYRGSGVVNFAVGALAMVPAMVFAELRISGDLVLPVVIVPHRFELGDPLDVVPAALIALAVGMAVAAIVYPLVIRPLRSAPPVTALVATVGLTLVLQSLAVLSFGNVTLRTPTMLPTDVVALLGRPYPIDRVWMLATVLILAVGVAVTYRATKFGLATRAAFLNEKGAVLLGLEPARLGLYNWMFAAGVAGIVGIIGSSLGGVSPFNYSLYVVPALGAALAARLRSIPVAIVAAVAIGSFEAIAVHIVAQRQVPRFLLGGISSLVPFVVIIAALVIVGRTLPNRSAIAERAQVPVFRGPVNPLLWVAVIVVAAVVLSSNDPTIRFAALQSVFIATLLMSVVVLTGLVGQVSLAQLSFAGFSAFMLSRFDSLGPFPAGPILAVLATTVIGTLVSVPALRVRGVQFAIVTFSIAVVFDDSLFRSPTFVGRGGVAVVEPPRLAGVDLGIVGSGQFPDRRFGYLVLAVAVLCALLVGRVTRGSYGRRFLAIRSNERAAAAVGISVVRTKVLGAGLASFVAAIAGVMFAYKSTTFNGGGLTSADGLALLALAYLGGIGSVSGAVIGGVLAPSGLFVVAILGGGSSIAQYLLTGCGLILVAVKFPAGIAGSFAMLRRAIAESQESDGQRCVPPGEGGRSKGDDAQGDGEIVLIPIVGRL
jgi:branched-chain amino acid transport system permease protein